MKRSPFRPKPFDPKTGDLRFSTFKRAPLDAARDASDRSTLKRKTPLRAKPPLPASTPMGLVSTIRRVALKRDHESLRRSKAMRRARLVARIKVRTVEQGADLEYLAWVRTNPCCRCGASAPSHAHHEILNGRGKSQKAPDARTLPLCFRCHDDFHAVRGRFAGFTREQRRDFQEVEITRLRQVHAGLLDHGIAQEPLPRAV